MNRLQLDELQEIYALRTYDLIRMLEEEGKEYDYNYLEDEEFINVGNKEYIFKDGRIQKIIIKVNNGTVS